MTTSPRTGPALLEAKAIRTRDGRVVEGNLTVRAGEVVGLFGMVGAGKSEFLEALYGMRKVQSGSLASEARQVDLKRWSVRQALSCGLALVPEDRLKNALVATESGAWNLAAPHWRRNRGLRSRLGSMEKSLADQAGNLVTIKGDVAGQPVSNLSGGNKQKVSVARWLVAGDPPSVLLLDEPTQGLDVVARQEIYDLIRKLAQGGTAVLLASSDLEEAVTVTDRLYIMRAGHALEFSEQDRTRDRVLLAATSENENSRRTHA